MAILGDLVIFWRWRGGGKTERERRDEWRKEGLGWTEWLRGRVEKIANILDRKFVSDILLIYREYL